MNTSYQHKANRGKALSELPTNLTTEQKDYAIFLPAISSFYATFVGKQRYEEYIPKTRIPSNMNGLVETGNWLEPASGIWQYKWGLHSAGHASLDIGDIPKEYECCWNCKYMA